MNSYIKKSTTDWYKTKKKKQITTDGAPELSFKLYNGINEIISRGEVKAYKYSYKRFELSRSGKKFHPNSEALTDRAFDNEGFAKELIGLDEKSEVEIVIEKNYEQLNNILMTKKYLLKQFERIPNQKTKKQLIFINTVLKKFEDWYLEKDIDISNLFRKNKNEKASSVKKKTLTEFIKELCESEKLPLSETVDTRLVNKFLRIAHKKGFTKSNKPETIRKILSRLDYSKSNTV